MDEKSPWIFDTTEATFDADVLERSHERPVVLDFWAAWCGPCKVLGPRLDALALSMDGAFVLVKADADKVLEPARRFGVQGIPAVFGVTHGEVADQFVGALPEAGLHEFLAGLLRAHAVRVARATATTDPDAARQTYRELVDQAPDDPEPRVALARLLLDQGEVDGAMAHVEALEDRGVMGPEVRALKSRAALLPYEQLDLDAARQAVAAAPNDAKAALQLARALVGAGETEEALDAALGVIPRDRGDLREEARVLILAVLDTLPPDADLVRETRRRLSMALF